MQESGCECVCGQAAPLAPIFLQHHGSHPAASGKTSALGGTHSIAGIASTCGPTISGAHISQLIGHDSHALFTAHSLASTLPIRVFTLSPNSHSASGVTARTSHLFLGWKSPTSKDKSGTGAVNYQFALPSKHVIVPKYRFLSSLPVRVRADETRFPTQFWFFI